MTFIKNAKKKRFYCSRELSVLWLNKLYSLSRKGSIKEDILNIHQNQFIFLFRFFEVFYNGGITKKYILIIHFKNSYFNFVEFSQLCSFLLIHHLQVIRHQHPYHLNVIIKTWLQIKTRTTHQIQMTSTDLYKISYYTAKI